MVIDLLFLKKKIIVPRTAMDIIGRCVGGHKFSQRTLHSGLAIMASWNLTIILFILLIASPAAWSDTIKLKSGKIVHGKIREQNDKLIQLDVGLDVPITYYRDEVQEANEDNSDASSNTSLPASSRDSDEEKDKADQLEQQGLEAIDAGKMDEGIELLRSAGAMDPKGSRHLNLGSLLFGNGVTLHKQGKIDEALGVFRESEQEILQAIKMYDPKQERTFLSQAYFMLGEMNVNAFNDKTKARDFYKQSLSFYENPSAKRALEAIK